MTFEGETTEMHAACGSNFAKVKQLADGRSPVGLKLEGSRLAPMQPRERVSELP